MSTLNLSATSDVAEVRPNSTPTLGASLKSLATSTSVYKTGPTVLLLGKPRGVAQVLYKPVALDADSEVFAQFVLGLPSVVQRDPVFAIAAKGLLKEWIEGPQELVPLDRDNGPNTKALVLSS